MLRRVARAMKDWFWVKRTASRPVSASLSLSTSERWLVYRSLSMASNQREMAWWMIAMSARYLTRTPKSHPCSPKISLDREWP